MSLNPEKMSQKPEKTTQKQETNHQKERDDPQLDDVIWKAAIAAIIIGLLVTVYLVLETKKESYSALYLNPESYENYIEGDTVRFTYGVQSYETKRTLYSIQVFLGERQVGVKEFSLEPNQKTEDEISFQIGPEQMFPEKVLVNMAANNQEYSVHYWLKGRK